MFLKRIEMQGFKSFADRIVIDFDNPVTGIVGPNGCGKSNISDAIRWVLGEQSVKSLRGDKMTDVIFAGSETRKPMSMAEVTLVFDNSNHYLNSELDEIEITRRIYNTEEDAEYLINHRNVRLRDIQDLILDTSLGKDSLSMITQGNISQFAEAKPYDRRGIFEEAAGVSKYKKRKIESLNKLERTKENLDRTLDILNELEKQVNPLKRQARKAELYREKKQRLEEIEVAVLVDDIKRLSNERENIDKAVFDLDSQIAMQQTTIQLHENSNFTAKSDLKNIDKEIDSIQDKLVKTINEIQILEKRQVEIDEKRKYQIEFGSNQEKINQMKALLDEAKFEYDDRLDRLNKTNAEIEMLNTNLSEVAVKLADASLKRDEVQSIVNRLKNRIEVLKNVIRDPFSSQSQAGVKSIVANKNALYGIMGVVGQEIKPEEGYEEAIATALGNSSYNIATKDDECARVAIDFLKKNKSGRATFLPINALKARYVKTDDAIICNNTDGYLGTCNTFVTCSREFDIVKDSLLGNVLVCDDLENASKLAELLKYSYKIVTLDGDVIHRGGSMTGGKIKNEINIITASSELSRIEKDIVSYEAENELAIKEYEQLARNKESLEASITEQRISLAKLEPIVDAKRSKYEKMAADYELINPDNKESDESFADSLVQQLSQAYATRDTLSTNLKLRRDDRLKMSAEIDRKDGQIRMLRRKLDEANSSIRQVSSDKAVLETKIENSMNRLASEYQMTYEFALENSNMEIDESIKEEVVSLRKDISALGNINMDAPEQFSEVNDRYEFLKKNYDDLVASRDKILSAIEEMDEIMKTQFLETFNAINGELNNTFKALFGGGKARLVLEDENDILNTGIDIDVQPPGKSVKSIRLFSGGEKTLIAICVLFTILKVKPVPLIVFDEVEAALDQANVERFVKYVRTFEKQSQFLIITHRPGTMAECDVLYGVTMQNRGVSQMLKVKLVDAIEMAEQDDSSVAEDNI